MATENEFGFVPETESNDLGFVPDAAAPVRVSNPDLDAFVRQYIKEQQPNALQTATTPLRLGADVIGGILGSLKSGAGGLVDIAKNRADQVVDLESLIKGPQRIVGDVAQTAMEAVPQAYMGLVNIIRQGARYAMENPQGAIRNIGSVINPLGTAAQEMIAPPRQPSSQEVADAFARELTNQATAQQSQQPILGEITGQANVPLAQALPDIIATALASPELASGAYGAIRRIPAVARETARTGATLASSPPTFYRAASKANPYLSGQATAAAEEGLTSALGSEAALGRSLAEDVIKGEAVQAGDAAALAAQRGEAATVGRESLQAGRALKAGEAQLQPQIINAQTTLDQAAQSPVVILGKTADEPAAFGRKTIENVQEPLKVSEDAYEAAFTDVTNSLPEKQPIAEAPDFFKSASESKAELSDGFQAKNKGEIKQMLDETSKITKTEAESNVSPLVQKIYDAATPQGKLDLLATYPDLGQPPKAKVKRPKYNWDQLQMRRRQINQGINDAVQYGNTGDVRILEKLKDGLDKDMERYASNAGVDTFELFQEANKQFAEHQNKFGLNRIQTILKDDVIQNPEFVASKLIADNNPSMVEAVKKIVTPEEFQAVQARFSKRLFSPNADTPFDPSHFIKKFSDADSRETYRAVFGDDGFKQLEQVYEASKGFDKIADFQKTLDALQKEASATGEAFAKKRGRVNEAEAVLAEKKRLQDLLRPLKEANVADKIRSSQAAVEAARKELDRVKNYRDLKDWLTRASGLNILKAAFGSPKGIRLSQRLAAAGVGASLPSPDLGATIEAAQPPASDLEDIITGSAP